MSSLQRLRELRGHALDFLRIRLSAHDEVTIMAALGLVSGLLAGVVILAFRLLVESTQSHILPDGSTENFEALEPVFRLLLCIAGGLTTGLLFQTVSDRLRNVGIVHVMERLASYQGHLPLGNALMQFLGGAISIISGHSVGREGPGIHLGAAAGSQLGVRLGLPNNTVRTLTACGVAASIAASFNTPLAGVIFAMEVVMMEYTLYGFAPVILAAVSATTVTHLVYGNEPAFSVPEIQMLSLSELPLVLLTGLAVGLVAAAFNHSVVFFSGRLVHWPTWLRMTVAGTLTGLLAMVLPQIMGIGYDTVTAALLGELGLLTLIAIAAFKLLATTAGIGLGLPGGLIGPTLVVGATVGGAVGAAVSIWLPAEASQLGFYALLGMGAMMAATLQAPLAALTAMLELTGHPNIIMPGLLALITAGLSARRLYRVESVFVMLMRIRGLDYRNDPIAQHLRRLAVSRAMDRSVAVLPVEAEIEQVKTALAQDQPRWILARNELIPVTLLPAADVARALEEHPEQPRLDLLSIPADRRDVSPIPMEATLQEALEKLRESGTEALYVTRPAAPGIPKVYGVLTESDIEQSYRF